MSSLTTTVELVVVVRDNQKPQLIGCPSNSTQNFTYVRNTTAGLPTAPVNWPSITPDDNVDGRRLQVVQTSSPSGFTDGSLFHVGLTHIIYRVADRAENTNFCFFDVLINDVEPPRIICPNDKSVTTSSVDQTAVVVGWDSPIATDNYLVSDVITNLFPDENYTVGRYNVTFEAFDPSGNTAFCFFTLTVNAFVPPAASPAASSASSTATTAGAAGAAGGVLLLLVILLILAVLIRRRQKKKLEADASGYAELMNMSDEFILERAKV